MRMFNVEQGGEEWRKLRLGIPTASRFDEIITPTGKPRDTITCKRYLAELVAERLLQQPLDGDYQSGWMRRGTELQGAAAEAFATSQNCLLDEGGFITTDDTRIGCSPDNIIRPIAGSNARVGVEIKVPSPQMHTYYLLYGMGDDYKQQVQGQMYVGEFDMMHFYSWNPGLPPVHVVTQRNDIYIARLARVLDDFCRDLDASTALLRSMMPAGPLPRIVSPDIALPGVFPWR